MSGRRWTVVVVPQGAGTSREVEVSHRFVKGLVTVATALAVATIAGVYFVVTTTVDISRLDRLEHRNEVLEGELDQMAGAMSVLADTIETITRRDRSVRLLAGLEPNDPEVQQAGIGGPAGPLSASDVLLRETILGRRAVTMREDLENLNRRAQFLLTSFDHAVDTMETTQDLLERTPSIMPTAGFISSGFSRARMHPVHNTVLPHLGIDVPAPRGTSIAAPAKGRVVDVGVQTGYGKIVTIDHGQGIRTRYAHCSEVLVKPGQWVERGAEIALVGKTGITTNYHLHYEVMVDGKQVDPRGFIFERVIVD